MRAVQMISKAERSRFAGAWLVILFLPVALAISSLLLLPQFRSTNATDESATGAGCQSALDWGSDAILVQPRLCGAD
jgi:hypothetical protein